LAGTGVGDLGPIVEAVPLTASRAIGIDEIASPDQVLLIRLVDLRRALVEL
jgi:hypothetical protein